MLVYVAATEYDVYSDPLPPNPNPTDSNLALAVNNARTKHQRAINLGNTRTHHPLYRKLDSFWKLPRCFIILLLNLILPLGAEICDKAISGAAGNVSVSEKLTLHLTTSRGLGYSHILLLS